MGTNIYVYGEGQGQTSAVFWQFCWYLIPFYLTWVPYVALQFSWASGTAYSTFSFVMVACTLVPLQGLCNSIIYFRKRARARIQEITVRMQHKVRETTGRISSWLHSMYHSLVALRAGGAELDLAEDAQRD